MGEKNVALLKWAKELEKDTNASQWLDFNLKGKKQATTIEDLERAISDLERAISEGALSVRKALIFALIVGVQWKEKFEDIE